MEIKEEVHVEPQTIVKTDDIRAKFLEEYEIQKLKLETTSEVSPE